MPKKRFRSEEIIHKLREADVLIAQGRSVAEITRQWGVTEATDWPALTGPEVKRVYAARFMGSIGLGKIVSGAGDR